MRPSETRSPPTPLKGAGMRTEPPMSLPWAIGPIPVATAAPAPPLDAPAESVGSRGFRGRPWSALSAKRRIREAGALVGPRVRSRDIVAEGDDAVVGGAAGLVGVDLYRDRHAVQRSQGLPTCLCLIGRVRSGQRLLLQHAHHRIDRRVHGVQA